VAQVESRYTTAAGLRPGQDGRVISLELARRLRDGGLPWTPARGDRFVVADRDMDHEVFVLSDMTIELHEYPGGPVFAFNGTTEWALDSLEQREVLWLPAEHQLRDLLGTAFVRLERRAGRYRVCTRGPDAGNGEAPEATYDAVEASDAYALALLSDLGRFSPHQQ
jgi:hypothetical protein